MRRLLFWEEQDGSCLEISGNPTASQWEATLDIRTCQVSRPQREIVEEWKRGVSFWRRVPEGGGTPLPTPPILPLPVVRGAGKG